VFEFFRGLGVSPLPCTNGHGSSAALVHVTAPPVWWSSLPIPPSLFPRCIRQSCPRSRSCAKSFPSCPCHSRFRTLAFRFTRRHSSKSCHRLPPCLFNWKAPTSFKWRSHPPFLAVHLRFPLVFYPRRRFRARGSALRRRRLPKSFSIV
jgi:hypothetical protein